MSGSGTEPQTTGIRAVIFDMDGVLTDSEPLINAAAIAMFKEKGLIVQPEDFVPFVGTGEDRYIGGVAEKYHFPIDLPAAKARTYEIYLELVPKQLRAFPGATELVRNCRNAGLHVAVASSADRIKIEANLRQIGLPPESWDAIVTGEEVINKKPSPDIFLKAAAKLGFLPSECAVVEDAVNGVEAANAAGMRCVAVAQTFPANQLQKADLVRQNLLEVSVNDLRAQPQTTPPRDPPSSIPITLPPPIPVSSSTSETKDSPPAPIRPWGFWATAGLTFAIFVLWVIAQALVLATWLFISHTRMSASEANTNGFVIALTACATAPLVLVLTWLFSWIRAGSRALEYLAVRMAPAREFIRWGIPMVGLVILSDGITKLAGRPIVPDNMVEAYQTARFLPLFWFTVLVVAPLTEETLFRGFLFEGILHSKSGVRGAFIITAAFWASIHVQYDWYGKATIFVFGLFLAYVRLKTGSILVTMCLHSLMNLFATVETAILLRLKT
jgi:haloacid dehalogenase superfamily, subfamily IA, variant 3 with third motif having DD or ED/haloacid dehalogenase superfamily, subfamily IA, variant 1 with third motif having Dx(3-4)D or Dx(3-4)E